MPIWPYGTTGPLRGHTDHDGAYRRFTKSGRMASKEAISTRDSSGFSNVLFRIDHQTETSEIIVKGQTGHVIEQVRDHHERERITVGEFLVP